MNVTLSIDDDLVKRARRTARSLGISLNELIRRQLQRAAGLPDGEASFEELRQLLVKEPGRSRGWVWNREEIHGRSRLP